jgi:dimethylamine/trimethylamine dehydrogenase
VIYDDDHYMGGVLAELLVQNGNRVTFLTPSPKWNGAQHPGQGLIQSRLLSLVEVRVTRAVTEVKASGVAASCAYTGRVEEIACDAVLTVTSRLPNDNLYTDLMAQRTKWADRGIQSVKAIGDAQAPAAIAWATYAAPRRNLTCRLAIAIQTEVAGLKN